MASSGDDLVDATSDLAQRVGRRHRGFRIELGVEFVPAGGELSGPAFELGEAVGEVLGVEGAVFECG
ncbi:MAG TPA: hypothetical protein VMA72_08875 [Streptosporangiaceae bacterium]|nr:hypothetical protein [Streptosporangiaceae bacterium]